MMKESEDQHVNDVTGAWPADLHREWDTDIQNETSIQNGFILDDFENAPRNWLIPAICSAVFFFPTGILAVRNAIKAQQALEVGFYSLWRFYVGRTRFFVFLTLLLGVLTYCVLAVVISIVKNS